MPFVGGVFQRIWSFVDRMTVGQHIARSDLDLQFNDYAAALTVTKAKLDSIEFGATANAPDAALRSRATHTGTQAVDTLSGVPTASILGRAANGTGAAEVLTPAQARTVMGVPQIGHLHTAADLSPVTGPFYTTGVPAAPALRHAGRAFIGVGHAHGQQVDGSVTGGSWLQSFTANGATISGWDYYEDQARLSAVTDFGIAAAGVSRTSGGLDAIGTVGAVVNDGVGFDAWGAYVDAVKATAGAGYTHAMEVNSANLPGTSPLGGMTPYKNYVSGMIGDLNLAAGSDAAVFGRSYAIDYIINMSNNGAAAWTGINFRFDAIMREGVPDNTATPGNTGYARAVALAHDQGLSWYSRDASGGAGTQQEVFRLVSSIDNSAIRMAIEAVDGGITFIERVGTGNNLFSVDYNDAAANFLAVTPGAAGISPALVARGTDTNANLRLTPKGNGSVVVPTATLIPGFAPSTPVEGQFYYDNAMKKFRGWDGTAWRDFH